MGRPTPLKHQRQLSSGLAASSMSHAAPYPASIPSYIMRWPGLALGAGPAETLPYCSLDGHSWGPTHSCVVTPGPNIWATSSSAPAVAHHWSGDTTRKPDTGNACSA